MEEGSCCLFETGEHSTRRHLAVHPAVVDEVPVQAVEGAAGNGKAVGGFVVDVFCDVCYELLLRFTHRHVVVLGWIREGI